MITTRKNRQDHITNNSLIDKYIQLIQFYIQEGVKNPFIIFTFFCQDYITIRRYSSFFCSVNWHDQWCHQWRRQSRHISFPSEKTAALTEEEGLYLRRFFAEIKFAKKLEPTDEFVNLLGVFFLYFPEYLSLMQEGLGEKIHRMMIFGLKQIYSIETSVVDFLNELTMDWKTSRNFFIRHLGRSTSAVSEQEWLQILDTIDSLFDKTCVSTLGAVDMLASLADHAPSHHQERMTKKLLSYLDVENDVYLSDKAILALERFFYVMSKEQRVDLFNSIYNKTTVLTEKQLEILGNIVAILGENESLLAVNILCKTALYGEWGVSRGAAVDALGNLPCTIQQAQYDIIINTLFSTLEDEFDYVHEGSIRSLAKMALISSDEQRKIILTRLSNSLAKKNEEKKEIGETLKSFYTISNEKIEMAFKILLEKDETATPIDTILAVLSPKYCKRVVNKLCAKLYEDRRDNSLGTLGVLVPVMLNNHLAIDCIVECLLEASTAAPLDTPHSP